MTGTEDGAERRRKLTLLASLMLSFSALILTAASVSVALPTLREVFSLTADTASWLIAGYTLPYMTFMPLFGRLGDAFGKRRLLQAGLTVFAAGTLAAALAPSVAVLFAGRAVQGMGAAAVNPLCMSIISENFPESRRGHMLATWNVTGPVTGAASPLLAGVLLESFAWSVIFILPLGVAAVSVLLLFRFVPELRSRPTGLAELRAVDWSGFALLVLTISLLVFFTSSRPITGVAPFRDLRLLGVGVIAAVLLYLRERRLTVPLVAISLLRRRRFSAASLAVGVRMFVMTGISMVLPLFLADVHGQDPSETGLVVTLNAASLAVTMRAGGRIADRGARHLPVAIGLSLQTVMMLAIALVPPSAGVVLIMALVVAHGMGAGLSLGSLHTFAVGEAEAGALGAASGLYSLIRFSGVLLGAALGGVVLQAGIDAAGVPLAAAYRTTYLFYAAVGGGGAALSLLLRQRPAGTNVSVSSGRD
jgi:MFS family permease